MKASRRDVLRVVAGTSAVAVFGRLPGAGLSSVRGGGSSHPRLRPGADTNHRHAGPWLKQLHDFGPIRATGTPQCRALPTPICSAGSEKPVS